MPDTALATQPVSGFIGAKIDLDLSGSLDDGIHKALNDALDEHNVLFFCGQDLDPQGINHVTEVFAPLIRLPYISPSPNDPDTIAVLKEASGAKITNFGNGWYFGFSFFDEPPIGSVLVPPHDGDALLATQTSG